MQSRTEQTALLRLPQIIGRKATATSPAIPPLIPVSKSTWWAGVKAGRYPQPTRALGARITAWRAQDIHALIDAAVPARCVADCGAKGGTP